MRKQEKRGAKLKFTTPATLLMEWESYRQRKEANNDLITKENFLIETGNYINLFTEYAKKPEFMEVLKRIFEDCKYYLMNRGVKDQYNATIVKLLLNANYGVREKTDRTMIF